MFSSVSAAAAVPVAAPNPDDYFGGCLREFGTKKADAIARENFDDAKFYKVIIDFFF